MISSFRAVEGRADQNEKLVPLQEGKRPAQHPHAPLENLQRDFQKMPYAALARDRGCDFAQNRHLGLQPYLVALHAHIIPKRDRGARASRPPREKQSDSALSRP